MLTPRQYIKVCTHHLGVDICCTMLLLKMYAVIGVHMQYENCMLPNRLQHSPVAFIQCYISTMLISYRPNFLRHYTFTYIGTETTELGFDDSEADPKSSQQGAIPIVTDTRHCKHAPVSFTMPNKADSWADIALPDVPHMLLLHAAHWQAICKYCCIVAVGIYCRSLRSPVHLEWCLQM